MSAKGVSFRTKSERAHGSGTEVIMWLLGDFAIFCAWAAVPLPRLLLWWIVALLSRGFLEEASEENAD